MQAEQDTSTESFVQEAQEKLHCVWLKCMQIAGCSALEAKEFIRQTHSLLNTSLTPCRQTLLMVACSIGSIEIIRAALAYHPNCNIKDSIGRTALHYAAAVGNVELFQLLIAAGGNAMQQTIGGETPLTKACIFSQGDIIQWYLNNALLAFEVRDKMGHGPLQMLRVSGETLYAEVKQVYEQLRKEESMAS